MGLRAAVVRFPGSNCDQDVLTAARRAGAEAYFVWHRDTDLQGADAVLLPGASATGSRSSARRDSSRGRCSGTRGSPSPRAR